MPEPVEKPPEKKKGNRAQKGSSFERSFSKELSKWISEDLEDDVFWRTAGSGAMATNRFKKRKTATNNEGDLRCDNPKYSWFLDKLYLELKRGYQHWGSLAELLKYKLNKDGLWSEWNDMKRVGRGKKGMLIWKADLCPITIITELPIVATCRNVITISNFLINSDPLYVTSWDDFKTINPTDFRKELEITNVCRRTR